MSYYVKCSGCCERYELAEGSLQYKLYKERRTKFFRCEKCNNNVRLNAIKYLFGAGNTNFIDNQ
ncbi:hypothetical protein CD30_06685 [Ureibacillus massiliensis 4400831 = CIP 108448 = CCUG 49529]|uniref:DUF2197 domain-containing protein n=1 Tax=Ureibacillus massiliensis 4400831 = CIP 108448 = CCUG 49529 TaxID=1211035 RepID=A0A0A3J334_9BACL|nr:hypothetical protein [Ureibacillus massiliensis]KGR91306.1 hypothetical protein CD30_06685 [Ureibacillus massiliensis 4400831 = CIP 108448 = CCUG 49529]BDH60273.1 hypothetical protein MTP04_04030 [Lysinibacillus sp. PLM2]